MPADSARYPCSHFHPDPFSLWYAARKIPSSASGQSFIFYSFYVIFHSTIFSPLRPSSVCLRRKAYLFTIMTASHNKNAPYGAFFYFFLVSCKCRLHKVCHFSAHKLIHIFIRAVIEPGVDESDQQSAADIVSEVGQCPLAQNIAEGKSRGRGGRKVQQRERTEVGDDVFKSKVHEHDDSRHDGGHARRLVLNQQP